jgi:hypothetical protein
LTLREELDGFSRSLADHEWLHPPAPHFSPEHASEMMAIAVGRTGQPVRIVDHPVIKSLAHAVAPQFPLPNSAELRKAIIDVAKRWHKAFNCATQGDYISLMVDGASMASRRWLGVCIATDSGFWFWRMLELPGTTGEEIADAIKGVVRELLDKGFTTVAVVTDNAANEIKAVRELAQAVNLPLFRIPCLSHTTNLAVKDFLNVVLSGKRFWKDIGLLCNALPDTNEGDPFHGMKYPCATRWLSLGDFVGEIEQRIGQIRAYLSSQKKLKNALDIVNPYKWRELWQCFTVLNRFTVWTENEDSTMLEAWPTALGILRDLEQLRQQGNRFAGSFHFTFYNRLLVTADIGQLLLGYLITAEGIQWYRSLPDRSSAVRMGSQEWVNSQISPLVCHIARLLGTDPDAFDSCWQKVLKSTRFDPAAPIDEFWNCLRTQTMTVNNNQYRLQLITEMVRIVAKLPVSEAEVERAFSALRQLFGDRSQRAKHDLIEARLTIRMNRLEVSPEIQTHAPSLQDPDGDLLVSPIAWSWASRTPSSDPKSYPLTRVPTRGEKLAIASSRHSPVRGAPSPA